MKFFMHFFVFASILFNSTVFADVSNTNVYKLILWPQHGIKIASGGSTTPPDTGGPVITEPNPWPESDTISILFESPDTTYEVFDPMSFSWVVTGADLVVFSGSYGTMNVSASGNQDDIISYLNNAWGGTTELFAYNNPENFYITAYDLENNTKKIASLSFEVIGGQEKLFEVTSNNLYISEDKLIETISFKNLHETEENIIELYSDKVSLHCPDRTLDFPNLGITNYFGDIENFGMGGDLIDFSIPPKGNVSIQVSLDSSELPLTEDCFYSFNIYSYVDGDEYLEDYGTIFITAAQIGRTIEEVETDGTTVPDGDTSDPGDISSELNITISELGAPPKLGSKSYSITNNEDFPVTVEISSYGATDSHNWRTWYNNEDYACFYERYYKVNGSSQTFTPTGLNYQGSIPANSTISIDATSQWKGNDYNPDYWIINNPGYSWLGGYWQDTNGGLHYSFVDAPFQTCATDFFISFTAESTVDSRDFYASNYIPNAYDFTEESSAVGPAQPNLVFYQPTSYSYKFGGGGERHTFSSGESEIGLDWTSSLKNIGLNSPGDSWSCEIYSGESNPLVIIPFDITNTRTSGTLNISTSIQNKSTDDITITGMNSFNISAGNYISSNLNISVDSNSEILNNPNDRYEFTLTLSGDFYKEGITNSINARIYLNMSSGTGTECHATMGG